MVQQETAIGGVYDGNTSRVTFAERRDGSYRVERLDVPADVAALGRAGLRPALAATEHRVTGVVDMLGAFGHGVVEGR